MNTIYTQRKSENKVCKKCGSNDIERLEWRKVNTGVFNGIYEGDNNDKDTQWCCDCEEHVEFSEYQIEVTKKHPVEVHALINYDKPKRKDKNET